MKKEKVDKAYTSNDYETCCFCSNNKELFVIDGNKLTSEYIWSLNQEQREDLINKIIKKIRVDGFPYKQLLKHVYDDEQYINKQLQKLKKADPESVMKNGYLSNSGILCLDVCRYMCQDLFWKTRGDDGTISIEDVFNDDILIKKVLKNRMGWNLTTERGHEEPYIFDMSPEMIIQGIRSSKIGYGVSNFRPMIAKFIYSRYLNEGDKVFDYSCGWGARMLAAWSLGLDYSGADPLVVDDLKKFDQEYLGGKSMLFKTGSENSDPYNRILEEKGKVDMCMSCPPYFTLEKYSNDNSQCYNKLANYEDWLEEYWKPTVSNCNSILKDNGYFVLIIKDYYKKFALKDDMSKIITDNNMELIETFQYKTQKDHLSSKRKSGVMSKNSEYVLVFKKC